TEFWEVISVWGPEYAYLARKELWEHKMRWDQELHWFPPWSLWLVLTVPLAGLSGFDAPPWGGRRGGARAPPVGGGLSRRGRGPRRRTRRPLRPRRAVGAVRRVGDAVLLPPARVHVRPHVRDAHHARAVGGAPVGGAVCRPRLAADHEHRVGDRRPQPDRARGA